MNEQRLLRQSGEILSDNERLVYEDFEVVNFYARQEGLQKAEEAILKALEPELPAARMLDIGVGGGRTAVSLAPLVREYVGVDFSGGMVEACRERFAGTLVNSQFDVADARSLDGYADASFDIVLFSFNGLDTLDYPDRTKALYEMRRVLRPGGYLWFSTHNKFWLGKLWLLSFVRRSSIRSFPRQVRRLVGVHVKNFPIHRCMPGDYSFILDGVHDFRSRIMYMDPRRQLLDLQNLGFHDIRVFRLQGPLEIPLSPESLALQRDPWLYFLCRRGQD